MLLELDGLFCPYVFEPFVEPELFGLLVPELVWPEVLFWPHWLVPLVVEPEPCWFEP